MKHIVLKKMLPLTLCALLCLPLFACGAQEETPAASSAQQPAPTEVISEEISEEKTEEKADASAQSTLTEVNGRALTVYSEEDIENILAQANAIPCEDFTMKTFDGGEAKLSDFQGKVTVVNVMGSWCGYCIAELPYFEEAHRLYGDAVNFVGIDAFETGDYAAAIGPALKDAEISFPVLLDENQEAGWYFSPRGSLPVTYFLDENGTVRFAFGGAVSSAEDIVYVVDFLLQHGNKLPLPLES